MACLFLIPFCELNYTLSGGVKSYEECMKLYGLYA